MEFSAHLSTLFSEVEFERRFQAAAFAGFTTVEFWFPFQQGGKRLIKLAKDAGLRVSMFNLEPGDQTRGEWGTLCVPGREDYFKRSFDMAVDLAAKFPCRIIHLLAGRIPEGESEERCLAVAEKNLLWATSHVPDGLTCVIEAINPFDMPNFLFPTPSQALSMIKQINHPSLRLLFDMYHSFRIGEQILPTLLNEIEWIGHMQIADFPGRHEPGTGEIPFELVFRTIHEMNYLGYIGLEYYPLGNTTDSFGWMAKWMDRAQAIKRRDMA
jgi:hydroxypyruvate isomerase